MENERYLYGASVQGIQGFIFQTNKLKEIVGASELVEQICTEAFQEFANNGEWVISAAGNIKYIFNNREDCEKAVREFPKKVLTMAPGITLSQAVVMLHDDYDEKRNELERKLREARNYQIVSQPIGLMGIRRSRNTGLPAIAESKDYHDAATIAKLSWAIPAKQKLHKKLFGDVYNVNKPIYEVEKLTGKNDWIAVIHADGNGLGDIVKNMGGDIEGFKQFSKSLSIATENAAREAVKAIATCDQVQIVPVVIGGDDLTVIIRADIAVDFANAYMKAFEQQTENLCDKRLTACAGIAFIKSSYPFYYGYDLAEALCSKAKNLSGRKHSCLLFHKVQDSFIKNFEDIKERELTPVEGSSFLYGPYYVHQTENTPSVEELKKQIEILNADESGTAAKTHLRQWLSLIHESDQIALQRLNRVKEQTIRKDLQKLIDDATKARQDKDCLSYKAYDLLALSSVIYQETK